MSAADEAPPALAIDPGIDLGIDAKDLEHLVRAALHLCGLAEHEAILVRGLRGPGPLLLPDALDLGAVWLPLTGAAQVPPEKAARVLLLLLTYLGRNAQGLLDRRPPRLPEEAAAAIQAVRSQAPDAKDLDGQIPQMAQLAGEFSAAGYTPPPEAPRSSYPRLASLIGPLDPPLPVPAAAQPAPRAPAPQKKPPPSQPGLKGGGRRLSFVGMISATLLVLLAGYWGVYGYYRLYLADRHTRVDLHALQVVMPIRDARVNRDTLIVITPDGDYAKKDPEEQTRLGRQLLAVLAQPAISKVTILSGDRQYRITPGQRGSRMQVTPPVNRPGQLRRQPGQPGRQPGRRPGAQPGQPGQAPAAPVAPEPAPQAEGPTSDT